MVSHTLAILLAVALSAAGCLTDPAPEPGPPVEEDPPQDPPIDPEPEPSHLMPFVFPLEAPFRESLSFAGSFEAQDVGVTGGFLTGAFVQEVDLSALLPADVPTRLDVRITVDAEEIPIAGPTSRVDPVSNDTVWYEYDWSHEPPTARLSGVFKRSEDGTLGLRIEAYTSGPADPPSVTYTVRAEAEADPDAVPDGVPVALQLSGNETLHLEARGEMHTELLVYGPNDALVDRLYFFGRETWDVPRGMDGEFVFMPVPGSESLVVHRETTTAQGVASLRALGFVRESGEAITLELSGTQEWGFSVEERPLRVLITVTAPEGAPWLCSGTFTVRLASPNGLFLEQATECPSPTNAPFLYEESWTWGSSLGDPGLGAGAYEASVEPDLWHGFHAFHTVERYAR